jgi:hypothetical protein
MFPLTQFWLPFSGQIALFCVREAAALFEMIDQKWDDAMACDHETA